MSDILSQDEVDALLSAVSSEGEGEAEQEESSSGAQPEEAKSDKALSLYDFRRPDRVSKDQMRTIQNIHEGYARNFSTTLTNFLRTFVEIELVSVDQLTYSEFIMSISNPSCIYIFNMEPLEGSAILEINPSLVFFIIDRMFGGQGTPSEQTRELTTIEEKVVHGIVEKALEDLKDVWEHIGIFTPRIEAYETNPQFVQISPPGETVILISLEIRMENSSGLMSLCFPYMLLEGVINKLSGESWKSSQSNSTRETRQTMQKELQTLEMPLSVLVGKLNLKIRDLLQLKQGDILCLDKPKDEEMIVQVGSKTKMAGSTGVVRRKKAVKITKILEREVPGSDE